MRAIVSLLIGLLGGCLSGLIGIGGGVFIVPALVVALGMSQHMAQGTTLAILVPPIGILAAWAYYKQGQVDIKVAALVCLGFLAGSVLGSKIALGLSERALRKTFGTVLGAIALKMLLD